MALAHPLDNPIWHALGGPHAGLGTVHGLIRRYQPQFAPFAAWETESVETRAALAVAIPVNGGAVLFTTETVEPVDGLETVMAGHLLQMVATGFAPSGGAPGLRPLQNADVPAMQRLIDLTRPGPFAPRTIEMGRYLGLIEGGELVAMAGERLRLNGFTEVSAVCTHPDHRGRGYAKALVSAVAETIVERGETPFLQVLPANQPAIATYERLGFATRRTLHLTVVRRPGEGEK